MRRPLVFDSLETRTALDGSDATTTESPDDLTGSADIQEDCGDGERVQTMGQGSVVLTNSSGTAPAPPPAAGPGIVDTILDALFPATAPAAPAVGPTLPYDSTADPTSPDYFPAGMDAFTPDPNAPVPVGPISPF